LRRLRTGDLAPLLLVALALLLLVAPWMRWGGGEEPRPLELFARAAELLNRSVDALKSVTHGLPPGPIPRPGECYDLGRRLVEMARRFSGPDEASKALSRASEAYGALAFAASRFSNTTPLLQRVFPRVRRALLALAECRVDEALQLYRSVSGELRRAEHGLSQGLRSLASADPRALLSNEHRELRRVSAEDIGALVRGLGFADAVLRLAEDHRGLFEEACSGNSTALRAVAGALRGLGVDPSRSGPLAYELYAVLNTFARQGCPSCTSSAGGEGSGGGGAGYAEPTTDD